MMHVTNQDERKDEFWGIQIFTYLGNNGRMNSGIRIQIQYLHISNQILYSLSHSFWMSPCQLSFHSIAGEKIYASQDFFLCVITLVSFEWGLQLLASFNQLSFIFSFGISVGDWRDDHQAGSPSPVESSQWWAWYMWYMWYNGEQAWVLDNI